MNLLRRYPLVLATIAVGLLVAGLYLANAATAARFAATIYVLGIIVWVSVGMVKDILRGHWGLDILAVVAMAATLATGEHAAGRIVALMLTAGRAREAYAEQRARRERAAHPDPAPEIARVRPPA